MAAGVPSPSEASALSNLASGDIDNSDVCDFRDLGERVKRFIDSLENEYSGSFACKFRGDDDETAPRLLLEISRTGPVRTRELRFNENFEIEYREEDSSNFKVENSSPQFTLKINSLSLSVDALDALENTILTAIKRNMAPSELFTSEFATGSYCVIT